MHLPAWDVPSMEGLDGGAGALDRVRADKLDRPLRVVPPLGIRDTLHWEILERFVELLLGDWLWFSSVRVGAEGAVHTLCFAC